MKKHQSKIIPLLPLFGVLFIQPLYADGIDSMSRYEQVTDLLTAMTLSNGPGIQYVVVDKAGVLYEHSTGLADLENKTPLTLIHAMAAFSMTKSLTRSPWSRKYIADQ